MSTRNGSGPLLANGDRMSQPEFHRRYLAYPGKKRFELVGGTVYMASPMRWPHGLYHLDVGILFRMYERATPGVETGADATAILGKRSEPQPDLALRIQTECGGRSLVNDDEYIEGPPELLAEIAYSSRAIDLNQKRDDYRAAGVLEYLVLSIEEQEIHWFHFADGTMIARRRDGIYRSRVFPGLWLHGPALLARDSDRSEAVMRQGIASRAHAGFVKQLQRARRSHPES